MAAICKVEECSNPANIRKLAKEFDGYCSNHRKHIKTYGSIQTKEDTTKRRSETAKGKQRTLGKTWKIKDTSKMTGRVPKTAFKKGHKTWSKGLKNPWSKEHIEAIKKANTKYTKEELMERNQLRSRSKTLKRQALKRDICCKECQSMDYLQLAHIGSWSDYPDLRLDINNVRILCMNCHYRETYDRELESGKLWGYTNMIGVL